MASSLVMIFDLIDQIYDAALNPDLLPAVLAEITTLFGAVSTTLVPLANPSAVIISPGGEEAQRAYAQHWWKHDSIVRSVAQSKRDGLFCDWTLIPDDVRARDPFYQEFRRSFDMKHNIAFAVDSDPGQALGISLQLPHSATEPPDDAAVARFASLGRHFSRAMTFNRRTTLMDMPGDALSVLMTTVSCGVAFLDGAGRVLLANATLERFERDGLRIREGILRAARSDGQAALDQLIRRTLQVPPAAEPSVVSIARPSGRLPLLLSAVPMTERRRTSFVFDASRLCRVVVTVIDPAATVPTRVAPLLRSLGLSPAEARLACLVGAGLSPREAADQLRLTEGTARTRLKLLSQKLGVSRQSELTRLVTQLALVNGPLDPS